MNVIGYLRVSTREQADSGAGLAAQRSAITREADHRGWGVTWIEDAGESGKTLARPGIRAAFELLKTGQANALIVAKLDRLSRSVQDFAAVMAQANRERWSVVALDLGVDTTTPAGELVANVMASVAQWERKQIGARTRDALAERRAAGIRLGRERMVTAETVTVICDLIAAGWSYSAISRQLDTEQIPTPNGAQRWWPSTIARIAAAEQRTTVA